MATIFRYAGFGKESVFGTAVTAAFHLDQGSTTLDSPSTPEIIVPTGLGRSPRVKVPGFYCPAGGVDYAWDIETIGWFLRWALPGGYQFTELGSVDRHELWGTDVLNPQSFTTRIGKDIAEFVYAGCIMNGLTLSVDNGLVQASLDIMAQKDSKATIKTTIGDLTLPADPPLTFANLTAEVNDEDYQAIVKRANIRISNNTDPQTGRTVGSRYPSSFQFGARDVLIDLSLLFPDTEMMTLFWGSASGITDCGSTTLPLELAFTCPQCPTDTRSLTILIPNSVMEVQRAQPRGRDQLIQEVSCRAMIKEDVVLADSSTVDTDILCTLLNTTATMA